MKFFVVAVALLCSLGTSFVVRGDHIITDPADLWDTFRAVGDALDTFPGNSGWGSFVHLYNPLYDQCVGTAPVPTSEGGNSVQFVECNEGDFTQLFRVQHQGDGFVSLSAWLSDCIGFGSNTDFFQTTYTGDWCQEETHQFRLEVLDAGAFRFIHRANEDNCVEVVPAVFHRACNDLPDQHFLLCSTDGASCYPSSPEEYRASQPNKTSAASILKQQMLKRLKTRPIH